MTKTANTFYFDYTMMSAFLRCRFYYYFRHIRHLIPKVTAAPLSFGKTWHSATEIMEGGGSLADAQNHFKAEYKNETKDLLRTPERGVLMLKVYDELNKKRAPIKFLYTEAPGKTKFAVHLTSNIILCGRMDGIAEWVGGIYVWEKKTTSRLGLTYFEKFELNYQIDSYCLGCMELMGACNGAIVDVARVVTAPPNEIKDFLRHTVSRTKEELVLAKKNIIEIAYDMQNGPLYQNKDSCMLYYRKCQYHDLCMGACDERIVRASYEVDTWDPSHGLEEKANDDQLEMFKKKEKKGGKKNTSSNSIIEL